ncbi:MAG: helix-turn-helix transcriptional regulator [Cyclobacteriaceae bacterium]|nr:helix-turn-helix transcriptional regulator [Cyclobacteriaceae bacterium]
MTSKVYIYKRVVQSKLFIDAHYSEAIDLDNIADEAYFSKFHFIRLFKSIYGKTPHQYLISVRVEQSKLLLQKGLTVTQSCTEVGFESLTSFTALFKKYVRLSPSEYQRIYLAREEQIRTAPLEFIPACFASQYGWN